ncbi:hypothetical protein CYMTET_56575 [Cymbomonas tetramitiformis]|uniref:Uncharacterized protein n=1 Tax=Cymbomonas tetramitiformis TaxID=36881 RepID=A0AAE0BC17_9CHLO|nr:hypothetical protein CYMTET_56575 [Cymbomonas tetramitiformis]
MDAAANSSGHRRHGLDGRELREVEKLAKTEPMVASIARSDNTLHTFKTAERAKARAEKARAHEEPGGSHTDTGGARVSSAPQDAPELLRRTPRRTSHVERLELQVLAQELDIEERENEFMHLALHATTLQDSLEETRCQLRQLSNTFEVQATELHYLQNKVHDTFDGMFNWTGGPLVALKRARERLLKLQVPPKPPPNPTTRAHNRAPETLKLSRRDVEKHLPQVQKVVSKYGEDFFAEMDRQVKVADDLATKNAELVKARNSLRRELHIVKDKAERRSDAQRCSLGPARASVTATRRWPHDPGTEAERLAAHRRPGFTPRCAASVAAALRHATSPRPPASPSVAAARRGWPHAHGSEASVAAAQRWLHAPRQGGNSAALGVFSPTPRRGRQSRGGAAGGFTPRQRPGIAARLAVASRPWH